MIEESNVLLEWAIEEEKSKEAISLIKGSCLVVTPTKKSAKKWESFLPGDLKVICYNALKGTLPYYNTIILDEVENLTEGKLEVLRTVFPERWIGLSVSLPQEKLLLWANLVNKYKHDKITIQQAIDSNLLPIPQIYIYNIVLDNNHRTLIYEKGNDKKKKNVIIDYSERFNRYPTVNVHIRCSELEYYMLVQNEFEYWTNGLKFKQGNKWGFSNEEWIKLSKIFTNIPILGVQRKVQSLGQKRKELFFQIKSKHYQKLSERLKFKERKHIVLWEDNIVEPDKMEVIEFSIIMQGTIEGDIVKKIEPVERLSKLLTHSSKIMLVQIIGTKDEEWVKNIIQLVKSEYIKELKI